MNRLPVELISEISLHALPFQPSLHIFNTWFSEKAHLQFLFDLQLVCRHWSDIARDTPMLWTILSVTIPSITNTHHIGSRIERSRDLALFVRIISDDDDNFIDPFLLEAIRPHIHRCKVLAVSLSAETSLALSHALGSERLKRLEHLDVNLCWREEVDRTFDVDGSPTMLTLHDGWLRQISIDWKKLTHFFADVDYVFLLRECIHLFRCASHLSHCSVGDVSAQDHPPPGTIVHSSLKMLSLQTCDTSFWGSFTFPSLLELSTTSPYGHQDWAEFKDFVHRSSCSLRHLRISDYSHHHHASIEENIFSATPDLEELHIGGDALGGSILASITECDGTGNTETDCQSLSKLNSLVCSSFTDPFNWSSLEIFLRMMMARPERTLQVVEIRFRNSHLVGQDYEGLVDRKTFASILDVGQGLEFRMIDDTGSDFFDKLKIYYHVS